ncbi:hypothetical protein [Streptomyces sp. NPDC048106]|uniref:hypothetical protein n=1 Tax=Streptomyces sp. NPDC048106 TaxID=3155750 RepID=UPI003454BD2A
MTAGPAQRPLPPVTSLTALGALGEQIATNNGQSSAVTRVTGHGTGPDLLFKRYKKPLADADARRLDRLVAFGRSEAAAGRPAREVLLRHTSWPVARVEDDSSATVGCLIPMAPDGFRTPVGGFREIDTLARSDERFKRNGTPPTPEQRITACRCLVGIAAALEQRRFVYSDWNYANAFWNPADYSIYLIDMDGCAEGSGADICQPGWEDPLARPPSSVLLAVLNDGPAVRFPVVRSELPKRPATRQDPTPQAHSTPVSNAVPGRPASKAKAGGPAPDPKKPSSDMGWAAVAVFVAFILVLLILASARH